MGFAGERMRIEMTSLACPSCGKSRLQLVTPRQGLSYNCCRHCGHCTLVETAEHIDEAFEHAQEKYYGESSILLLNEPTIFESETLDQRGLALGRNLNAGSNVIEVGPGAGHIMGWLLSHNHSIVAVEHSPVLAKQLEERYKTRVLTGEFEVLDLSDSSFDAFCSFHVIEHVRNPLAHLTKAVSLVRPGGIAFVATPNSKSWEQILFESMSPNFDSAHIFVFSPISLGKLATDAGWEVVSIDTPEYSSNWIRVVTKMVRRCRREDEESTAGKYSVASSPFSRLLFNAIRFCSAPFRFIQSRMGYGNEIFMVLRKPL